MAPDQQLGQAPEPGFHKLSEDPCYHKYQEALQCLNQNGYNRGMCQAEFLAFKACRRKAGKAQRSRTLGSLEDDPLLGWAFKMYNDWAAKKEQEETNHSNTEQ